MKRHYLIALLVLAVSSFTANKIFNTGFEDGKASELLYLKKPVQENIQQNNDPSNKTPDVTHDEPKTPDAPTTEAFVPNNIASIPAANPAEELTILEAPTANSMGNAALSFPIKLPPGRKGLEPKINIEYNSEGLNGWLGQNWRLLTSSIMLETRWGAPRYDASLETETYLLDGEQLSPVAHRAVAVARTGEKQFYPRIEGSFEKIIRHNSGPGSYWWEVTDKSGIRQFYGGNPTDGVDPSAILTDANGNIAYWGITESRDPNGNFVKYRYTKVADAGNPGGSLGSDLYISSITYTGHGSTEGKFSIEFIRDRQLGETKRPDVIVNARFGFKQVTADRLRKIVVKYNGQAVRTYELQYITGAFYKSLLSSIAEFDAANVLFNTHSFEYYNDVQWTGSAVQPLAGVLPWNPVSDNVHGTFLNPLPPFNDKASALGGNKSLGGGFGMAITVGPFDGNLSMKTNTAGVSFGFNYTKNEGMLAMVDIDGDGLVDKVYKRGGSLFFRPNQFANGSTTFGQEQPIKGISDFNKGETFTGDIGLESHFGIFAGFEFARTEDLTSIYFADVNGDMLIDIVRDGTVYFNHIDGNGDPSFTTSSGDTPSPIDAAGSIDPGLVENDPQALEAAIDDNPLHDVVRVWRAPFDGTVSITAPVALLQDNSPDGLAYTADDGVRVAIQVRGTELWSADIPADDFTAKTPTGVNSIAVSKGDKIYFRVQSKFNGAYDQVSWTPQVTYSIHTPALTDANALPLYQFKADNDFLISGPLSVGMAIGGAVKITGDFVKPVTSDDVVVRIVKKRGAVFTTLLEQTLAGGAAATLPISIDHNVLKDDAFFFSVSSSTNIDWAELQWNPFVYYTSSADPAVTTLFDVNNNPLLFVYPVVDFQSYNKTIRASFAYTVPVNDTFAIQAHPDMNFTLESGDIVFAIKKENELLAKQTIPIGFGGTVGAHPPINLILNAGDKLFFEYHVKNEKLADAIDTSYVTVNATPGVSQTLIAGLHTVDNSFKFGPMYRHWGQFAYNGNRNRASQPINESELVLDDALTDDTPPSIDLSGGGTIDEMQDIYDNAGGNQPKDDKFIYLVPDNQHKLWIGYDNLTYVKKDTVSSSRMGKDNLLPVNPVSNPNPGSGSGAVGITKVSNTDNFSLAAGIGPAGVSTSFGYTKFLYDFLDMNGDRYPDILSTSKVQYTHPYGGLESSAKSFSFGEPVKTEHWSLGFTLGGTFLRSNAPNEKSTSKGSKATKAADQSGISAGISGNFNLNRDSTAFAWMDINNDDMPDRVYRDGTVELNLGYSFLPAEQWGYQGVNQGSALSFGAGLSINIGAYSISAGIGLSRTENETTRTLQDMNGDGLLDYITDISPLRVAINTGNGFAAPVVWQGADAIAKAASTGESVNAAFTVGIPIIPIAPVVKLCINPSINIAQGADRTKVTFQDIDGDGSPDLLESDEDSELKVRLSTIQRTNLLKKANRPMGASFTLDYKLLGNTYDMPNHVWALSSVDVFDGLNGDGADHVRSKFEYQDGHFDRHEREFYGFKKVITQHLDTENSDVVYRKKEEEFIVDNFYEQGLLKSTVLKDAAGNKFTERVFSYELKDIHNGTTLPNSFKQIDDGAAFPALMQTQELFYEGGAVAGKTTSKTFAYDVLGNITSTTDAGDDGAADDMTTVTTYHSVPAKYIMNIPSSIVITGNAQTFRQSTTAIDNNTGNITEHKQFLASGDAATTNSEYDARGNVTKVTRPQNATGQRLSFEYQYDTEVQTYVVQTTDSYGYTSRVSFDVRFGKKLSTTDINGQQGFFTLDNSGRTTSFRGPFEVASGQPFTLSYEYHPEAAVPWALTKQFDPAHPTNPIEYAVFCDGFGRVVQSKKDGAIFVGPNTPDQEVMIVSGADRYDAFGRIVTVYHPTTEAKGTTGVMNLVTDNVTPSRFTYDVTDRELTVTQPDLVVTTFEYGFGPDRDGVTQFRSRRVDGNGISIEKFTNVRDLLKATKQQHSQGTDVWTSYEYNPVNEMTKVTDDKGNQTISVYDRMGRRTSVQHPDAGLTTYDFDLNGHAIEIKPANLQGGVGIKYVFDRERLQKTIYPQNTQDNVVITYGATGASFYRAGRIVTVTDGSGTQEYFYNALGATVKNKRTIIVPGSPTLNYTTEWTYDSWNRLTGMIYPDLEVLTYNYNVGGYLLKMSGVKSGTTYNYLPQLGYDKFEDRVYMRYGNNTETRYTYEAGRRRLHTLTAETAADRKMMDNTYTYDHEENILGIVNSAPIPPSNLMGGSFNYHYSYDDLYRLTNANGSFFGSNHEHRFSVEMEYDNLYNITHKKQLHERRAYDDTAWAPRNQTTYEYHYDYNNNGKPHAAAHIGDRAFSYDANGNQTGWQHDVSAQNRNIAWNEENRIKTLSDNGETFSYIYDATGARVLKNIGLGQTVRVNGKPAGQTGSLGNYIVYVNPYIVVRSGGFTKHYYIEGGRIVSKLGESGNGNSSLELKPAGNGGGGNGGGGNGNNQEAFQFYYHKDHIGNTAFVTDRLGEAYQHLEYFPFGEIMVDEHGNQERTPYLYNGKELDEETDLYYYGARYYDTRTSTWTTRDIAWELPHHVDRSPYAYVLNNPMLYHDPDGLNGDKEDEYGSKKLKYGSVKRKSLRLEKQEDEAEKDRIENEPRKRRPAKKYGYHPYSRDDNAYYHHPGPWAMGSIPARSKKQSFTVKERADIDYLYKTYGCHSCGENKLGGWAHAVPDHQPVSALIGPKVKQRLYPHCHDCSSKQGGRTAAYLLAGESPY